MNNKTHIFWLVALIVVVAAQWSMNQFGFLDSISSDQLNEERKVVYWAAPMDPSYTSKEPGKSPMGMDLVPVYEDELHGESESAQIPGEDYYYTCGMHPNIHELESGTCPICGMNLVKKNISNSGSPGQVSIDPVTVQNMGVQSVSVSVKQLVKTIRTVGTITYDERLVSSISSKVSGWAEKLYIDYTGQTIRKGDPLIEIYSPELVSTQEEYLQALEYAEQYKKTSFPEAIDHSKQLLNSTRKRLALWDISEKQIKELERTKSVKKTLTLYSPINGIVTHKALNEGDKVMPNMHLYEISDVSRVWVNADIYEYELAWIKIGQKASMTLSYLPGKAFEGTIAFIYPYMDAKTRTVKVRFEFSNQDLKFKPDMYANVTINSQMDEPSVTIPISSAILSGERSLVFLDLGEGKFEPREVTLGIQTGDDYEVVRGLHGGEKVVVSAQFLLDSESRLREAQMKMLNPEQEQAAKSTVTLIGDSEMTHICPMPEDLLYADSAGSCPICGMNLEEMTPEQKTNLEELQKSHEVEHIEHEQEDTHSRMEMADDKFITLIGDGKISYVCPMDEDILFSDKAGDCPICGMHLKEMDVSDHDRLEGLKKKYEVKIK